MAPPPEAHLTLVAIPFSHYNIYACWALERAGLRVARLVRVLPLLHMPAVAGAYWWHSAAPRKADATSSPLGTPVLFASSAAGGGAAALRSSAEIVAFADGLDGRVFRAASGRPGAGGGRAALAPAEAAAEREFVAACEQRLGPAARLFAYAYVLYSPSAFLGLARSAGPVSALLWVALSPLLAVGLRTALGVWGSVARRTAAEAVLRAEFARASALLVRPSEGGGGGGSGGGSGDAPRRFLFGDAFGPADLAFAALGFYAVGLSAQDVACGALRGAAWSPSLDGAPAEWRAFAREMRETPAGQHILRMVREERGAAAAFASL